LEVIGARDELLSAMHAMRCLGRVRTQFFRAM
jgi:hypothetical protein